MKEWETKTEKQGQRRADCHSRAEDVRQGGREREERERKQREKTERGEGKCVYGWVRGGVRLCGYERVYVRVCRYNSKWASTFGAPGPFVRDTTR